MALEASLGHENVAELVPEPRADQMLKRCRHRPRIGARKPTLERLRAKRVDPNGKIAAPAGVVSDRRLFGGLRAG
jgi:hypothetical protein